MNPGLEVPWSMNRGLEVPWSMNPGLEVPWSMNPGLEVPWSMNPGFTMLTEATMENILVISITSDGNVPVIVFDMKYPIEQTNSLLYIGPTFK